MQFPFSFQKEHFTIYFIFQIAVRNSLDNF